MENTCIKVLSVEHGARVVEYYKSLGVDTKAITGRNVSCYYGVDSNIFMYSEYDFGKVIKLPEFPRRMIVWDDQGLEHNRIVVCDLGDRFRYRYLTVFKDNEEFYNSGGVDILFSGFQNAKKIPEKTIFTKQEIADKLGVDASSFEIEL